MSSLTALRLVHPRLRGELFDFFNVRWLNNGSSPLTRGTHTFIFCQLGGRRFIPAYAGNSALACSRRARRSVHPRLRGELRFSASRLSRENGSSPLTRGTLGRFPGTSQSDRFIPAYAGNSMTNNRLLCWFSVHPRLRGELEISAVMLFALSGSSPLTRGTRQGQCPNSGTHWFIPAYAGNSVNHLIFQEKQPVHPRLRGELTSYVIKNVYKNGSSPLTRGTRSKFYPIYRYHRFIPAYAGNSLKDGINPSIHTLGI